MATRVPLDGVIETEPVSGPRSSRDAGTTALVRHTAEKSPASRDRPRKLAEAPRQRRTLSAFPCPRPADHGHSQAYLALASPRRSELLGLNDGWILGHHR